MTAFNSSAFLRGIAAIALTATLCGSGTAMAQDNEAAAKPQPATESGYPDQNLDWTIAFGPGGGNDIMSRTIVDIIQKYELYPNNIVVQNRAGGSGAIGWGYLFQQKGDPYNISTTSGSFINTPLQASTPWQPTDFVPLALMATDDLVLVVNKGSPIDSFDDFVAAGKEKALSIGGIGSVNVDFITSDLLAKAAGYQSNYVAFNAQGELTTALLSDSLDAMFANPGEIIGLIEAGDLKPIVYTGKETPKALGDLQTLGDFGYADANVSTPRGVVMPPETPKEIQDWWVATLKTVANTPEWKEYIDREMLTQNLVYGDEFGDFLKTTQDRFKTVLKETGAIK